MFYERLAHLRPLFRPPGPASRSTEYQPGELASAFCGSRRRTCRGGSQVGGPATGASRGLGLLADDHRGDAALGASTGHAGWGLQALIGVALITTGIFVAVCWCLSRCGRAEPPKLRQPAASGINSPSRVAVCCAVGSPGWTVLARLSGSV